MPSLAVSMRVNQLRSTVNTWPVPTP
jgi:hypothetical protein